MYNFMYSIPTKIAFGKENITRLPNFVKEFGEKVLLVYGGGSIKKNGIYDTVVNLLKDNEIKYVELSGVEPNPRISTVRRGVELCRKENVEVVLPIGGGSTIDCAKAIAAAYYYDKDAWDIVLNDSLITKALPIISILTLAATGSEMDIFSVISNEETKDKIGIGSEHLFPKYSIMIPEYTYSVPKYQTAAGTADIMSHIFEVYLNGREAPEIQKGFMESMLKTCIKYGPIACKEPENYEARANLMWTSSWAINGFISCGNEAPWPCHAMEHQLSAYYDVTHGHGLAILTPVWMEYILNEKTVEMFAEYGKNVFEIDKNLDAMEIAKQAIEKTKEVYRTMELSDTLRSIGINTKENFEAMAKKAALDGLENCNIPLKQKDIIEIYNRCF